MVQSIVHATLGTAVDANVPLMSAGLDSLSIAELVRALSTQVGEEVSATDLFDHPTIDAIVQLVSSEAVDDAEVTND